MTNPGNQQATLERRVPAGSAGFAGPPVRGGRGPGRLRRLMRIDGRLSLVGVFVTLGLLLIAIQLVMLVVSATNDISLFDGYQAGLRNFSEVFRNPVFWPTIRNTLVLGLGSVAIMLLLAVPFAWMYARTNLRGRGLLLVLLTVQIAMPGFLVAIGYTFWLSPTNGMANLLLHDWLGIENLPFDVYSMFWLIFLQGMVLTTPAFFMLVPSFEAMDGRLEEASLVSGVSRLTTTLRISIPLVGPAIIATGIFYFIVAIEMFDFGAVLGLPVQRLLLSTWMYQLVQPATGSPQYGQASALGVLAVVVIAILMIGYLYAMRRARRNILVTGKPSGAARAKLSRKAQVACWVYIGVYIVMGVVLPVLSLLWSSVLPFFRTPSSAAFETANLDAYGTAFEEMAPVFRNTAVVVIAVPTLVVLISACTAWVSTRTKSRAAKYLDGGIMVSVAIPSIVGAVAFLYLGLSVYQSFPIYSTIWILVLAMLARQIPWANRTISSSMIQIAPELEEVASTAGVSRGRTLTGVITPIVRSSLLFSWFWIALLALRELTVPALLSTDGTQVLSTIVLKFTDAGQRTLASAIGVILLIAIAIVVCVFQLLMRRMDRRST
ncbi:iron ABC transporter permease [Amycolatopsis acidicola]|uniref:Iron ABC transporter permease n=1 Tax=Amycolatopsis acidicola TaxID=2596893 RepID=A0A5N0V6L1_9PSEU|nr:iron ABC transporter permease [Amycolatopsis acidicola]KAA9160700.1 iron ABC transporter permease [Amycolatopsis acidicola]